MSHVVKVFIRVIHARIRNVSDSDLDASQFAFRQGSGTSDALLAMNLLIQ